MSRNFRTLIIRLKQNEINSLLVNDLNGEQVTDLADALKFNTSLHKLNLSYSGDKEKDAPEGKSEIPIIENPLGPQGAEQLASALVFNTTLKMLDMAENEIMDEGANLIADALSVNSGLTDLNLSSNSISENGAKNIFRAVKKNNSITSLKLGNNLMSDRGAEFVSAVLAKRNRIVSLDLSKNLIGEMGGEYIGRALQENTSLRELNLSNNELLASGACLIAEALEVNTGLVILDLSNNQIGDAGAQRLADALQVNDVMVTLNLASNFIGDIGGGNLADTLKVNDTLACLRLSANRITNDGAKRFTAALKDNTNLVVLNLEDNEIISGNVLASQRSVLKKNFKKRRDMFKQALNGTDGVAWNRSRVSILGQGSCGKSATVRALQGLPFNSHRESTIGAEITENLSINEEQGRSSKWKKLNTNSSGLYTSNYASRFAARIMLNLHDDDREFTDSNRDISEHIRDLRDKEKDSVTDGSQHESSSSGTRKTLQHVSSLPAIVRRKISKVIMTTKANPLPKDEIEFVKEFDEKLVVKAKKDAKSLSLCVWDFGGQDVFYPMHHIFLQDSGTYIVAFDSRDFYGEKKRTNALAHLSFWLRSLRLHARTAPVVLVGTFAVDHEDRKIVRAIDEIIREQIKNMFPQLVQNLEDDLVYFPVDNQTNFGIDKLRQTIETAVRNDHTVFEAVPVRWMILLDEILSERKKKTWLSHSYVTQLANTIGIRDASEIDMALELFHDRGMLFHLTQTEKLKRIVVLHPQWLIDGFCKIIRDKDLHRFSQNEFEVAGLKNDLQMAFKNALPTPEYIEYLLKSHNVKFFVDFMRRVMLLSEWKFMTESYFLVPSLLADNSDAQYAGLKCVFDFSDDFLPLGVFERLICLCACYKYQQQATQHVRISGIPKLSGNFISMDITPELKVQLLLKRDAKSITLFVHDSEQASRTLFIVNSMLRKINHDAMNSGLRWQILLEDSNLKENNLVIYEQAKEKELAPWFGVSRSKIDDLAELDSEKTKNVSLEDFILSL